MYKQKLYKILEDHIKPHTIAKMNKAKKWEYGYNKDYDIVIKYEYQGNEEEYNPSWAQGG